jgi:hypothetical protein
MGIAGGWRLEERGGAGSSTYLQARLAPPRPRPISPKCWGEIRPRLVSPWQLLAPHGQAQAHRHTPIPKRDYPPPRPPAPDPFPPKLLAKGPEGGGRAPWGPVGLSPFGPIRPMLTPC